MRVLLFAYFVAIAGATLLDSEESSDEQSTSEHSFDEKLQEAYQLLKGDPNAYDTMELRRKVHSMKDKIIDKYMASEQPSDEVMKAEEKYAESVRGQTGVSAAETNMNNELGFSLFQGDIMLTKQQANEILEDIVDSDGDRKKRQAFRDENYPRTLWSNGVNYAFWNASHSARRVFLKAAEIWRENTCLEFREDSSADDVVWVVHGSSCWSHLGRVGGAQILSLGDNCDFIGLGLHEIGHTLGLYHTHARHDRDNFIELRLENLINGWEDQFAKQSESTNYNYNITYDYGTVMHYGATAVSKNGKPYVVPRDTKFLPTLGSYILSFYEKLMVNLHYKCLDKCTKATSAKCGNGGFPHPRDCSKCICPSGYGGRLCKQRPPGCGKELTATNEFQDLWDVVGQKNYDRNAANDDFYFCNYWIRGPRGSKIEVIFQNYTENLATDGCVRAGVEIKTLKDKAHTGYRFCSPNYSGTSLISAHDIVPVITYSRLYEVTSHLRYR
ncbi:hypothetical protein Angca_010256, partial [Angiostrongylus cantonensis]